MSHYIAPRGVFETFAKKLIAGGWRLRYRDAVGVGPNGKGKGEPGKGEPGKAGKVKSSKTKYSCPECGLNAWAKPDVRLGCVDCSQPMVA